MQTSFWRRKCMQRFSVACCTIYAIKYAKLYFKIQSMKLYMTEFLRHIFDFYCVKYLCRYVQNIFVFTVIFFYIIFSETEIAKLIYICKIPFVFSNVKLSLRAIYLPLILVSIYLIFERNWCVLINIWCNATN